MKTFASFEASQKKNAYFRTSKINFMKNLFIDIKPKHKIRPSKTIISSIFILNINKYVKHNIDIYTNHTILRMKGFLNSDSEINLISQKLIKKTGLHSLLVQFNQQKVITTNGRRIQTYEIHTLMFEVNDRLERMRFFENTFFACDIDNHIVLNMP